jgi:hypothetical protein
MKLLLTKTWAPVVGLALLLWTVSGLSAEPAGPARLLRQAYATLSVADHDYNGHRYNAMKQIESAAKLLKFDLRGDGRGHERQGVSDEQLRGARSLLEQAQVEVTGRPRKHIERAIKEINIALKIH